MARSRPSAITPMLRIGWFTTANGPGSRGMFEAVLQAIQSKHLKATFEFVFINRERGQTSPTDQFIHLAEANHIPVVTLSSLKFRRQHGNAPWAQLRESFDNAVIAKLRDYKPDISVMAGYMLFAPEISRQMLVINQHPALPGGTIGKWQDAIWDVIQNGDDRYGSMIHVATQELDRGPLITICSFPVRGRRFDTLWDDTQNLEISQLRQSSDETLPLFTAIRSEGVKREQLLVVETLKAIADREIDLNAIRQGTRFEPVDLTERVEQARYLYLTASAPKP